MLVSFAGKLLINTDHVLSMRVYKIDKDGATEQIVITFRNNGYDQHTILNTNKALYQAVRAWMEHPSQQEQSTS